ncbi:ATP-dependent nuclease [Pseudoalteromonas ruthenica]|uniref:ATP-dependent nuclease n=1 Tax=Pseudoalteromonas ruthenica TaxID=151081 RepID=UPI001486E9A8|nr:AAA family ATPase [Pseudoalteromonas ruthenica]
MIDRKAKIADHWDVVSSRKGFDYEIEHIDILESDFTNRILIDVKSSLISLCGKNGAGKSSILHSIYASLKKLDSEDLSKPIETKVSIRSKANKKLGTPEKFVTYGDSDAIYDNVILLDPSEDALNIRRVIAADNSFFEDYVNNGNESELLNEVLGYIKSILFKDITSVTVIEVEGKLDNSNILPYIQVYNSETVYGTLDMGQGEHKVLYLIWRLLTLERNTIVLLEEPEAFLCSRSQEYFMDFLAYVIQKKKLHVILTTHSDIVLKKQSTSSCSIVKRSSDNKINLILEKSKSKYLDALGLKPPRKGVFLVEDRFAKLMLQEIFMQKASVLSNEYFIDSLGGESHILSLAMHYNSSNIKVVPVLDADMVGKVNDDNYLLPIYYLPSNLNLAPEAEILEFISSNKELFAESLPIDTAQCLAKIYEVFSNFHDWFDDLDKELGFNNRLALEKIAIKLWIDSNTEMIDRYIVFMENLGKKNKSKLFKGDDGVYFVVCEDFKFQVCKKTLKKYNLENYIGESISFMLLYCSGVIKAELAIT